MTRLAKIGISTPAVGITIVTDETLSIPLTTKFPVLPTHKALQPVKSVESDGVTAATLRAEKSAVGLDGVKSGINHL